ncbi:DNA repair protein RAD51 3 [Cryptosporidium felis]|nr:DNA repair protein RAD51 3 [Cryptosporidium felis]
MIRRTSALELFQHETNSTNRIATLCRTLDRMLCGGIIIGKGIFELCGVPGTGKTQLCKQLALNIQIPKCIGGPGLNAIYIDTEGGFSRNRLIEMSVNTLNYIKKRKKNETITSESLVENIKYLRIFDLDELFNLLSVLPEDCKKNNVGILIIDSISMLIRICNAERQAYRLKTQRKIAKILENMSKECALSIIVTNHMTKKYSENDYNNEAHNFNPIFNEEPIEPSLGFSWNSLIRERLIIKCEKSIDSESRTLNIVSVANDYGDIALLKISTHGIQDIDK